MIMKRWLRSRPLGASVRASARTPFPIAITEMGAHCPLLVAGATLNAKKIPIVEDNYAIAESISRTIAEVGFATLGPVDTADRAICQIEQETPDGVLLDVGLREGKAIAVANALRDRKVPFVVLTAHRRETLPAELREAPYLAKPMTENELIDTVQSTFKQ
jgi:DNA-binding response OmpR family regulator